MSSYMDFLGETIAESYRTGKQKTPNKNNKLTKSRSSFRTRLENEATERGMDVADVALDYVQFNSGQIQKYVISKGELPQDENPVALAVQAYELRQREVEDIATAMQCDIETASIYLDEAENNAMEINSPESDSFIGEIFDAIGRVAGKGLAKASEKRQAKGKKPGAAGFFAELLSPGSTSKEDDKQGEDTSGGIMAGFKSVLDSVKEKEKKDEIKKMMPQIIIGVVILIAVVVLITKLSSKK
jgi:hypothetical protein